MQILLQDIRYSLRQFIKNPEFTLTALISLALGIGATTAVFSVIYAALMNLIVSRILTGSLRCSPAKRAMRIGATSMDRKYSRWGS